MAGKITRFVDSIPVYDESYVYLKDWEREFDREGEKAVDEFHEWAEENGLTGQEC